MGAAAASRYSSPSTKMVRLRLRVKIFMQLRLFPYYMVGQNFLIGIKTNIRSDILFPSDSVQPKL
jgi:hypothetical protein